MKIKNVNKKATARLEALIRGMDQPGDAKKWGETGGAIMPLVVDYLGPAQCGGKLFAVSQFGIQNGDLMRDPEYVFLRREREGTKFWYPIEYTNHYVGICQQLVIFEADRMVVQPSNQRAAVAYINGSSNEAGWLEILEQYYPEAFSESLSPTG